MLRLLRLLLMLPPAALHFLQGLSSVSDRRSAGKACVCHSLAVAAVSLPVGTIVLAETKTRRMTLGVPVLLESHQ